MNKVSTLGLFKANHPQDNLPVIGQVAKLNRKSIQEWIDCEYPLGRGLQPAGWQNILSKTVQERATGIPSTSSSRRRQERTHSAAKAGTTIFFALSILSLCGCIVSLTGGPLSIIIILEMILLGVGLGMLLLLAGQNRD